MQNLLQETIETLKVINKNPQDVEWIGIDKEQYMTWNDFEKIADQNYDNGYGREEINGNLVIVGKGFWLERWEYDGAEGWEARTPLRRPKKQIKGEKSDVFR